jgi:hypothetical protein
MPRLNQIEIAANKMGELVRSDLIKTLERANEAKTRLLIIDEVLDILGWSKSEYEPELATAVGGYTDYRLTIEGQARLMMPYRILCNDVRREGVKASPDLFFGLFCYVPLHKIRYGILSTLSN